MSRLTDRLLVQEMLIEMDNMSQTQFAQVNARWFAGYFRRKLAANDQAEAKEFTERVKTLTDRALKKRRKRPVKAAKG